MGSAGPDPVRSSLVQPEPAVAAARAARLAASCGQRSVRPPERLRSMRGWRLPAADRHDRGPGNSQPLLLRVAAPAAGGGTARVGDGGQLWSRGARDLLPLYHGRRGHGLCPACLWMAGLGFPLAFLVDPGTCDGGAVGGAPAVAPCGGLARAARRRRWQRRRAAARAASAADLARGCALCGRWRSQPGGGTGRRARPRRVQWSFWARRHRCTTGGRLRPRRQRAGELQAR